MHPHIHTLWYSHRVRTLYGKAIEMTQLRLALQPSDAYIDICHEFLLHNSSLTITLVRLSVVITATNIQMPISALPGLV